MGLIENIIAGVAGGIIVAMFAMLWRRRIVRKYKLSEQAKLVLSALWDQGLIRPSSEIADELNLPKPAVTDELGNLNRNGLVRVRKRNDKGTQLWKITWKGQEYLSKISLLGDLVS